LKSNLNIINLRLWEEIMSNFRFYVFLIVLGFSLISIPIAFSNTILYQIGIPREMIIPFIFGVILAPILTSVLVIYLITTGYLNLKEVIYTKPLEKFREKSIKRDDDAKSDAGGFIVGSMVICLSLFILLGFTSIMNVISNLPFVQMIPIPTEIEENIKDRSYGALVLHTIIISYIGPLMMFFMRYFHYALSIEKERFPGSRVVMGILFSAASVSLLFMIYQFSSDYFQIPQLETRIDSNLFGLMTIAGLSFSAVTWACDRLVFFKKSIHKQ